MGLLYLKSNVHIFFQTSKSNDLESSSGEDNDDVGDISDDDSCAPDDLDPNRPKTADEQRHSDDVDDTDDSESLDQKFVLEKNT